MPDFTTFNLQFNKGTDASPDWTGNAVPFGGSAGANEGRFVSSGLGATGGTSSAAWPLTTKPPTGTGVYNQWWAFSADTTGVQSVYTGDNTIARVMRWNWDNLGTFASALQFSVFDSTSHNAPSPGTQPSIVNGSSDTSNTSYVKANAYGSNQTPSAGSVGSAPSATTGTNGAVSPANTPAWLTNWQDLAGWSHYILGPATPPATTAGNWYITPILFYGANQSAATYTWVLTLQYSYT